jgi:hypothetical protein
VRSFSSICRTLGSSSTESVLSSETTALQAAAFPVILIFSGGTIISSLLGSVPGWLISPLAIANYAYVIHFAWSTWRGRIHNLTSDHLKKHRTARRFIHSHSPHPELSTSSTAGALLLYRRWFLPNNWCDNSRSRRSFSSSK